MGFMAAPDRRRPARCCCAPRQSRQSEWSRVGWTREPGGARVADHRIIRGPDGRPEDWAGGRAEAEGESDNRLPLAHAARRRTGVPHRRRFCGAREHGDAGTARAWWEPYLANRGHAGGNLPDRVGVHAGWEAAQTPGSSFEVQIQVTGG